jgi:hypothetical protein
MESKKAIQVSFVILIIESVIALLYSLGAFFIPELLTLRSFPLYTGQSWQSLLNENPEIANYIMILEGAAGGLGVTATLANLFVLLTGFRKGERWAWFFVLVVSILGWGSILITNILLKNLLSEIIMSGGMFLLVAALIISAKAFLVDKESL